MGFFFAECNHEFATEDIQFANISELKKPTTNDYFEWREYYHALYESSAVLKRVKCVCDKCGKSSFARCGLELPGKLITRRENVGGLSYGAMQKMW